MDKTLTLASGKKFNVLWDGVSSIDGSLRIAVSGATMQDVISAFTEPGACKKIIRTWDGIESVYTGFSVFRGVDLKPDGEIVVALNPEE